MFWTIEIGRDAEAVLYEVRDRWGNEVWRCRAALRVPLLGVFVERYREDKNGDLKVAASGDRAEVERRMIWFGKLRRMGE